MASKYQFITELYRDTLLKVTDSHESWTGFLRAASYNYKCSFDEQILIYAQRPNATAVLELEKWNEKRARQGLPKGTITLTPGEDLLDDVLYETGLYYSDFYYTLSEGLEMEIGLDCGRSKSTVDLALNLDKASFLSLSCTTKVSGGSAVKIPANSIQFLSANGPDAEVISQWISGLDFEKLLDALVEAEVPEELTDQLETAVSQLDMLFG